MAILSLAGEQPVAEPPVPFTHYEPSIPIESAPIPLSTGTSRTADVGPFDITPNNSSDHEKSYNNSEEDVQYAPIIRANVDGDETTLERRVSRMYAGLSEEERAEQKRIISLHRSRTNESRYSSLLERQDTLTGVTDDDPRLDPSQPEFDIYLWTRAFMRALDEGDIKAARAGFAFKNLNVSGTGSAVSLQQNVASILLAPLRLTEYVSFGRKPEKKILRDFNGVVKSGEMLVVLGRPGSGCSTFLKTICGELSGLELHEDSVVHYNGTYSRGRTFLICTEESARYPPKKDDQGVQRRGHL